ncbi:MAG TPA: carboxypeptidase regulatory-like domain-containing protein [Myxococcales bacterium]
MKSSGMIPWGPIAAMLFASLLACGGSAPPPPPPPPTYSISGAVSGAVAAGATVTLSGASSATTVSSATGAYTFGGLQNGAYTVTPSLSGYTFTPASTPVTISGKDVAAINFASAAVLVAPNGVTAAPGNGTATVSWSAAAGATGYNLYYGTSPQLTASSTKLSVSASPAAITGLNNGTAYYFAVSSVGAGPESPLSAVGCAVPTAANTAGLTLYDPLCGARVDGTRWQSPGEFSASVLGGAALLAVNVSNQESRTVRNLQYAAVANVVTGGHRVTTLAADISVPSASASRTGNAEIRASIRLLYSPPASRLLFPGGVRDLIAFEAGLMDGGHDLKAFRAVSHCDDASCAAVSKSNLTFTDPSSFASLDADGIKLGDSADYDVTYRVTISFDETGKRFHWSIANGKFGSGVSGEVNPAAYLGATGAWQTIPLDGEGFFNAQLTARTLDNSAAGGGSGAIAATFRNVWAGFDNAPAALFDDFSGTGGSSAGELSAAKWSAPGTNSLSMSGGAAQLRTSATAGATQASAASGLTLAHPESVNTIQADVTVTSASSVPSGFSNASVQGTFYNTGIPGTTAPDINQPNSAVGDVLASIFLQAATNDVVFSLLRLETANGAGVTTQIARVTVPAATVGASTHTLRIRWDPTAHTFTFAFDGQTRVIDPTVVGPDVTIAAPVAKAANWRVKRVFATVGVPAAGSGSTAARVNNVFTAP